MSPETLIGIANAELTIHIGQIRLGPEDTEILLLAFAAALLSAFYLWRIGKQEDRRDRLAALRGAAFDPGNSARSGRLLWYRRLGSIVAASPIVGTAEQERLLRVLAGAGLKNQAALATLFAGKLCGCVTLAAVAWLLVEWTHLFAAARWIRLALLGGALLLGWRLPDLVVSRLAALRRVRIEQGMPDALDLLVICAEAGLSLNQAIQEISRHLRPSNPAVAEEFAATAAELRVLPDVGQALDNLAERTSIASLRGMIATLKQSIKFGTPLAEAMRILAVDMRQARQARIEERTARLPVLLSIPLAMFILPCMFMVIGTPVALRIVDTLKSLTFSMPGAP